jgi:ABC-2 type transport system permease protein
MSDGLGLSNIFRFKIAIQTMKDYWKTMLILTILFMAMAAMYAGMFPAFEESLKEMAELGMTETYGDYLRGGEDMATYVGFLNLELYQIFFIMILGIILGFIAGTQISKEIEAKTIDLLMSNPVSRKQIVFEKYIGLIPMILIINFGSFIAVIGITIGIGEDLNFYYAFLTHLCAMPYFLAVVGVGMLISVFINEKMKAAIFMIAFIFVMFMLETIGNIASDIEAIGYASLIHYYDPTDILKFGEIDAAGMIVLLVVAIWSLIIAMIYFEHKDIRI